MRRWRGRCRAGRSTDGDLRSARVRGQETLAQQREIVEHGAHDELVDADGRYAMMYRQQYWLDEDGVGEDEVNGSTGEEVERAL